MKKNENNKGFSGFEILVVLTVYAIIFAVVFHTGLNSAKKTQFKALKNDATAFMYNVRTYLTNGFFCFDIFSRF